MRAMASLTTKRHLGLARAAIGVALHAVAVTCQEIPLDAGGQGVASLSLRPCLSVFVRPAPNNRIELMGAGIMPYTKKGQAVPNNLTSVKLIFVPGSHIPDYVDMTCDSQGALGISGERKTNVTARVLGLGLENSVLTFEPGPYVTAIVNCGNVSDITTVGSMRNVPADGQAVEALSPADAPRLPLYAGLCVAWIVLGIAFYVRTSNHGRHWMVVQNAALFMLLPALVEAVIMVGSLAMGTNDDALRRVAHIAACWKVIAFWHTLMVDPTSIAGEYLHLTLPVQLFLAVYLIVGTSFRTLLETSRRYGSDQKDVRMLAVVAHVYGFLVFVIAFVKVNRYVRVFTENGETTKVGMYQQMRGLSILTLLGFMGSGAIETLDNSLQSASTWGSHYLYVDVIPQGFFLLCAMMLLTICSTDAGETCVYDEAVAGEESGIIGKTSQASVWDDGSSDSGDAGVACAQDENDAENGASKPAE